MIAVAFVVSPTHDTAAVKFAVSACAASSPPIVVALVWKLIVSVPVPPLIVSPAPNPDPTPCTLTVSLPVLPALIVSELVGFKNVVGEASVEAASVFPAVPESLTVIVSPVVL